MKVPRHWLRRISRLLLLCLAFQNMAVAAHDCPLDSAPTAAAALAIQHCLDDQHERRQTLPDAGLCAEHCNPDRTTSATSIDPPTFAALPAGLAPIALATTIPQYPITLALRANPPKPPIRTRFCSLLI